MRCHLAANFTITDYRAVHEKTKHDGRGLGRKRLRPEALPWNLLELTEETGEDMSKVDRGLS
jgi:hypothetical protein